MLTGKLFTFHHLKKQYYESKPINNKQVFEFSYKGTKYTLLCTRIPNAIGELYFRKPGAFEPLILTMTDKFEVSLDFDDLPISKLLEFFNFVPNHNGKFNLFELYMTIDNNVRLKQIKTRSDAASAYNLKTTDGLYYFGLIDHDHNQDGNHFTVENRDKVWRLLPDLAKRIEGMNISVRFTSNPKPLDKERALWENDLKPHKR